jgi:hypothetical protein
MQTPIAQPASRPISRATTVVRVPRSSSEPTSGRGKIGNFIGQLDDESMLAVNRELAVVPGFA